MGTRAQTPGDRMEPADHTLGGDPPASRDKRRRTSVARRTEMPYPRLRKYNRWCGATLPWRPGRTDEVFENALRGVGTNRDAGCTRGSGAESAVGSGRLRATRHDAMEGARTRRGGG